MRALILLVIWGPFCLAAVAAEPAVKTPPFSPVFDGKSFAGWEGNVQAFRIQDGAIVGGQMDQPVPRNEYLCSTKVYRDFELRLKFRLRGENVNAGVQFRSERVPGSNEMTIQVLPRSTQPGDRTALDRQVQSVIDEVDKTCRETTIYMIGPEKGKRLAELVRQKKPKLVVECGTAIGYSSLWIARELKAAGHGKLITLEIDAARTKQALENFRRAGLDDVVDARVGDARKLVREIKEPVAFLFLDCDYSNYTPCLAGIEDRLTDGAVVVADNVGIGAAGMKGYLDHVRSQYSSKTEWFDMDLPWGKRDAMEITTVKKQGP